MDGGGFSLARNLHICTYVHIYICILICIYMVQRRPVPPHPPCGWVMVSSVSPLVVVVVVKAVVVLVEVIIISVVLRSI